METIQNIASYHSVFAQAMNEIVIQIAKEKTDVAKTIIKHNIIYAFTLICTEKAQRCSPPIQIDEDFMKTIKSAIDNMKLNDKEWEESLIIMVAYQSLAGIKPTQIFSDVKAPIFNSVIDNIKQS